MKTIKENINNEIIIKNSRFITLLIKLCSNNINSILDTIKNNYPKATHYCYAYIYGNEKGCSDDKEPSRTAGFPMLNVLEKEDINNLLVVTVRYFGGIKLGAGGLVRAYTKSVTEALKKAEYIELIQGYKIKIEFDYKDEKQILYLLGEENIMEKNYLEKPCFIALIEKDKINMIHSYSYEIIDDCYIEKGSH